MDGDEIVCYSPFAIAEECHARGDGEWQPSITAFEGAVCFCDISGFTALTERLRKQGDDGAEKLVLFLNEYFDKLVRVIVEYGGDVIKFAGDAVLTTFRRLPGEPLSRAVQRSTEAAWEVMRVMNKRSDPSHPCLHIGIGAGQMAVVQVGGTFGRCEYIVAGAPLASLGPAVGAASPDFTVLSPEAWELVKHNVTGEQLAGGLTKLTGITSPIADRAVVDVDAMRRGYGKSVPRNLAAFVPGAIRRILDEGVRTWIAELRQANVLFFNITGLPLSDLSTENSRQNVLEAVNNAIVLIQKALYRFEGAINKVLLDDKGFVVLGAFGLPPLSHPDDSARAILAALLAKEMLDESNVHVTIGIASGEVFCGVVGSEIRREYTVMGDVVNTAARIMCAGIPDCPVLCDDTTRIAAIKSSSTRRITFKHAANKKFKGKKDEVAVYSPTRVADTAVTDRKMKSLRTMARVNSSMVGRAKELSLLEAAVAELVLSGASCTIVYEGERGMGKSRFLEEGKVLASQHDNLLILAVVGDALETGSSFHAWRGAFYQLLGLTREMNAIEIEEALADILDTISPEIAQMLPLLAPAIGVDIADNELTKSFEPSQRPACTKAVLIGLLENLIGDRSCVLFAEDYHFYDTASRVLLHSVINASKGRLLVVMSSRPLTHADAQMQTLFTKPNTTLARLRGLDERSLSTLVCWKLGVESLPPLVTEQLAKRSGGNPYFAQELISAMVKENYITVDGSACTLTKGITSSHDFKLPETMNALVTGRLDHLKPGYLHLIKVASTLGSDFNINALQAIFRYEDSDEPVARSNLLADLNYLCQGDFLVLSQETFLGHLGEAVPTYTFKNEFIRNCAYTLMLYTQRTVLHQRIAEHLETYRPTHAYIKTVAHHWKLADTREPEIAAKAMEALREAALHALANGQDDEGIAYLHDALWLCDSVTDRKAVKRIEKLLRHASKNPSAVIHRLALMPDEVANATAHFEAFDIDGNGRLDLDELRQVFAALGAPRSAEEIAELIKAVGPRDPGYLDLPELLDVVAAAKSKYSDLPSVPSTVSPTVAVPQSPVGTAGSLERDSVASSAGASDTTAYEVKRAEQSNATCMPQAQAETLPARHEAFDTLEDEEIKTRRPLTACAALVVLVFSLVFVLLRSPYVMAHATGRGDEFDEQQALDSFSKLNFLIYLEILGFVLAFASGLIGVASILTLDDRVSLAFFCVLCVATALSLITPVIPLVVDGDAFLRQQEAVWGQNVSSNLLVVLLVLLAVVVYGPCIVLAFLFWRVCAKLSKRRQEYWDEENLMEF